MFKKNLNKYFGRSFASKQLKQIKTYLGRIIPCSGATFKMCAGHDTSNLKYKH